MSMKRRIRSANISIGDDSNPVRSARSEASSCGPSIPFQIGAGGRQAAADTAPHRAPWPDRAHRDGRIDRRMRCGRRSAGSFSWRAARRDRRCCGLFSRLPGTHRQRKNAGYARHLRRPARGSRGDRRFGGGFTIDRNGVIFCKRGQKIRDVPAIYKVVRTVFYPAQNLTARMLTSAFAEPSPGK